MDNKKVAIVTGSARGIGFSIGKNLEENGYTVIFSDIAEENNNTEINNYIKCNIASSQDRKNLADTVYEKFGSVDILVNNAGIGLPVRMDILETTEESYDKVMNVNLRSNFFMCQTFANKMIESKKSNCKIINISSISSYASSIERGEYCISKSGISMVTQLFAHKLADYGICVFEVRPGIIMTDMTKGVTDKYEKLIANGITPIKRFGQPQDVANCVLACCSGLLDFSTGQILNADGGYHIRRF